MGKILQTKINRFDGGISNDIRDGDVNTYAFIKDYRIDKNKISGHREWRDWTNNSENISRFLYAPYVTTGAYRLYGFGDDGSGKPRIFRTTIGNPSWTTHVSGTTGARADNVFFKYKNKLYNWEKDSGGTDILAETDLITGSPSYSVFQNIEYTNVAQPVHHEADDIAYFFQDNKVHKLNQTSWTANVQTVPSEFKIVGGASYGNYLAIVCSPVQKGALSSVMFLWDRNTTDTLFSGKIDLGFGEVKIVEQSELGGIYIVQNAISNASLNGDTDSIQFKYYDGFLIERKIQLGQPNTISTFVISGNGQEEKGVLYFPAKIKTYTVGGTTAHDGIVRVWLENGELKWILDRSVDSIASDKKIDGIFNIEGSWYLAHTGTTTISQGGTTGVVAELETNIFRYDRKQKLLGVTLKTTTESNIITISYRIDGATSWTEILDKSSGSGIRHSAVNTSAGNNLPEFEEIQFQLKSKAAHITDFSFKTEEIDKDIY